MEDRISNIELATYYAFHIENPCKYSKDLDIRYFWIKESKTSLEKLENPYAKEYLENIINKYS